MALRHIVTVGDSVLTKVSRPVTQFDSRLHLLLDDMVETLLTPAAWDWQRPRWEFCAGW